jgi:NTE family protein
MYPIGFVLSGGGARGFAHLGIIQALAEMDIHPDIISGVSAGAIVGAFLASGKTPTDIQQIIKSGNLFSYTHIQIPKTGILRMDGLQKTIEREIPFKNIEDLPIPLFIGTSNLTEGKMEYRNRGELSRTVLASASIPVLFSPVELDGSLFADGGLLDNIPVQPLIGSCMKIIVSNVSPLEKPVTLTGLVQIIIRTFQMSVHARINEARDHADLYIEPHELTEFELLSVAKADQMFEIGYNTVKNLDKSVFAPFLAL